MSNDEARVILEAFEDKMAVVIESLDDVKQNMATKEDVAGLKAELQIIKQAVKHTNIDVRHHEKQITRLEAKAA